MRITDKKYSKMLQSFDFKNFPRIESELRHDSGRCFQNHSSPSEERLTAERTASKSLKLAIELFEG